MEKRYYTSRMFLCFIIILLSFSSIVYGSEASQMAIAHEVQQGVNNSASTKNSPNILNKQSRKVLYCNPVEYGNPIPYPSTTVPLNGKFYTFAGKVEWLPDDPGPAGNNSIVGIDSDGDCVRDDIERMIAILLPSSNQKKARKYMFEYAKWRGYFLKFPSLSTETAKDVSGYMYIASECVRLALADETKSKDILDRVFSKFHNTFPRSYRYIENNAKLGGWSTREKITVSCP